MVFYWILSDSKSPQVSRILLSILADLSYAVVSTVSNHPLCFHVIQSLYQSFGDCNKGTNYNKYNCHFHVPRFFFISLCGQQGQESPQFCKFSFFLLIIIRSGRLAEICLSVCKSKSLRCLCVSFYRTDSGLLMHHLFVWSKFHFSHNSQ